MSSHGRRRAFSRGAAIVVSAAVFAAGTTTSTATADTLPSLSPTDQRIHDTLTVRAKNPQLGSDMTGLVTDASTGRVLWSKHRFERQLPASTTKLVTAVNALETFGPRYRFTTQVRQGLTPRRVVLIGAGDPSLSARHLTVLAAQTAKAVKATGVTTVWVYVDDSLFPAPSRAYGWRSTYMPNDIRPVRALVVDQHKVWDTSIDAGKVFAAKLRTAGVTVRRVARDRAPTGAATLARVKGQPLDAIVATMLQQSDNDYAEALHRLVAKRVGHHTTWWGAAVAQREVLAKLGVDLGTSKLYDGSGLSRASRLTAAQLVAIIGLAFNASHPKLVSLQAGALPIAGRTGTLAANYLRYTTRPTHCAVGLIEAKTGTLRGSITLAGFARGADGKIKLFAFLVNGMPSTLTTRRAVDKLAATVTGCY